MKRDVILAVVIATVVLSFTIYFSGQNEQKKQAGQNTPSTTGQTPTPAMALTVEETAKHNTDKDCWLIIDNKVYNATDYIALHPGGARRIIDFCGKEATQAFATRGGNSTHSQSAAADLAKLYIGDIGGTVKQQPDPATIKNLRPQGEQEEENEEEYEDD